MPLKSSFYQPLPCKCGKITLKYCIVPFTKHNIPLSTLEKLRTSLVPHVMCLNMLQAETKLNVKCDCIPLSFQTTTPPASVQTFLHIMCILFTLYDCQYFMFLTSASHFILSIHNAPNLCCLGYMFLAKVSGK